MRAAACPATGDVDTPCAGADVRGTSRRASGTTWELVGATRSAGCGDVVASVPELQAELCDDLPVPG